MDEGKAAFHNRISHTCQKSSFNSDGKLVKPRPAAQPPIQPCCPECGSNKLYRDGLRYLSDGKTIQRWLCRLCGYRFSQPQIKVDVSSKARKSLDPGPYDFKARVVDGDISFEKSLNDSSLGFGEDVGSHELSVIEKGLNKLSCYNRKRQVCETLTGSKNLTLATELKTVAGEKKTQKVRDKTESALAIFEAKSITRGVSKQVVSHRIGILEWLVSLGANPFEPVSVWHVINEAKLKRRDANWSQGTKKIAASCYLQFCKIIGLEIPEDLNFKKWHKTVQKLPFVPLNEEIEQLIGACNRKTSTFLQLLRETGLRSGEAWQLTWNDLNCDTCTVTMNTPEKGSLPRQFRISGKLVAMLNMLPKTNQRIFGQNNRDLHCFRVNFRRQRNRAAFKLQNPRIKSITLHTLRHYYATMLYHKTKDLVYTQQKLGHRKIENTLIYTHLVTFQDEEYHSTVAKTQTEKLELINKGWDFICQDRTDGLMYFRKRK